MKFKTLSKSLALIAVLVSFSACNQEADFSAEPTSVSLNEMISEKGANPDETDINDFALKQNRHSYLYTESNEAGTNHILIYEQHQDGSLTLKGRIASGGAGSNDGLDSQGAVCMDMNHHWLYAVNAGDNSISSFEVRNDGGLRLSHTVKSGGTKPVSIDDYCNTLYVVNTGTDNIAGFSLRGDGSMTKIGDSNHPLSATGAMPAQISFTPDGKTIVVTEKKTNIIATYQVNPDGSTRMGMFTASTGKTPFGFAFAREHYMITSNAAMGTPGAGSCTSYKIGMDGMPYDINGVVGNR